MHDGVAGVVRPDRVVRHRVGIPFGASVSGVIVVFVQCDSSLPYGGSQCLVLQWRQSSAACRSELALTRSTSSSATYMSSYRRLTSSSDRLGIGV